MQMQYEKAPLRIRLKILFMFLKFILVIFSAMLVATMKRKKYQPTLHETMHGEKLPFSDQYFVPDEKSHK